jgi:hypothetical protein
MLNTVEMADSYFASNFFYKDTWAGIDKDTKLSLIETAERDVNAYLLAQDVDINVVYNTFLADHKTNELTFWVCGNQAIYYTENATSWDTSTSTLPRFKPTCYQCAVFEWAVFIFLHKDAILKAFDDIGRDATSVKVDNIGAETYWTRRTDGLQSDKYMQIFKKSPAMRFLDMIPKNIRIIR